MEKHEARLDFTRSAAEVERQVRAFNPMPGAFFELGGERIKVLAAEIGSGGGAPGEALDHRLAIACREGSIVPTLVKRAGSTGERRVGKECRSRWAPYPLKKK